MTEEQQARAAAALLGGNGCVVCEGCGEWLSDRDARFFKDGRWWRCRNCTPFMDRLMPWWLLLLALVGAAAELAR